MVRGVILDTGPLLDLLLYRFWSDQSRRIDENRLVCSNQFNISPLQLSRFLGSCQRIVLVPGVIVEAGRLARDELVRTTGSREFSVGPFWRLTIRELILMGIDERWTSFLLLDGKFVEELGPTDAALIRCAQELGQESIPILTHDRPLWGHCRKVHVSCMVTSEILPWLYMT